MVVVVVVVVVVGSLINNNLNIVDIVRFVVDFQ